MILSLIIPHAGGAHCQQESRKKFDNGNMMESYNGRVTNRRRRVASSIGSMSGDKPS